MRNNQPVTQIEHTMKPDDILVSRTDLKGHIVYANKAFCDIAGFTAEELKGKAHNIVRHPDMPASAFQDLWDTISAKKPWTGIVKNRCKNGDFYWVLANVSAEYNHAGQVSGYVSVRTTPSRDQIAHAESLYGAVNANKASLPSTLHASWLKRLSLRSIILASALLSLATLIGLGTMFISSLMHEKEDATLRVAAVPLITSVRHVLEFLPQHRGMGNTYLNTKSRHDSGTAKRQMELMTKLTSNKKKIDALFKSLLETAQQSPFVHVADTVKSLQHQWSNVKTRWKSASPKESFRMHTAVIDGLLALSSDLLRSGELSTVPDIGIAYLAEFMALVNPTMNENMGRLRGLGAGIAAHGAINAEQRDALLELYVKAKLERDALQTDIELVMRKYNPALQATLATPLRSLGTASDKYFDYIKTDLLASDSISIDSNQYFSAGTKSIAASLNLYDAMDKDLSDLLKKDYDSIIQSFYIAVSVTTFGVLGAFLLTLLLILKTFKPLDEIIQGMQRIVHGDYRTMPVKYAFDELGDITDAMKVMQSLLQYEIFEGKNMAAQRMHDQQQGEVEKAQADAALADAFESNVGALISGLASEADVVSVAAKEMDDISDALAAQSDVAMQGVDLGSSHVNSTAAAIEEMSMTIADVSRQVSETQTVSAQAVEEAHLATNMMTELTRVANQIGSIVGTISDIAEQTNLLALNASIEAARAGDAGRGFSVVAGEVKELANQTSRATSQIREQVEGIQVESEKATDAINKISTTIVDINNFTSSVAESMQQQAQAGREISDAAQQADTSMADARSAVSELASSANGVDKSSDEMIEVAVSMSQRTAEVQRGIDTFLETLRKR